MRVCACPMCGTLHEAVSAVALIGITEEQLYDRTHCRLCELPSSTFIALKDEPDLGDDELGYPLAVVPWLAG